MITTIATSPSWERCADSLVSQLGKNHPEVVARFYADFAIDNADLLRQLESSFVATGGPRMEVLQELEQRAAKWNSWSH